MENTDYKFSSIPLTCPLSVTKIHSFFYYELPRDYRFDGECHDFWELVYVDKGRCYSSVNDHEFELSAGKVMLIPPNAFHKMRGNGRELFNAFFISFSCKSKALETAPGEPMTVNSTMRAIVSKVIRESRNAFRLPIIDHFTSDIVPQEHPPFGARQLVKIHLEELLILLLREECNEKDDPILSVLSNMNSSPTDLADAVEKHLLENLETLSISLICETFHYSKNYICSHFKQKTGYTIIEYFNRAKVERAKELIREHTYSLATISEMLGFSSPGYFSKTFKRVTGLSPLEYQRSLRLLLG